MAKGEYTLEVPAGKYSVTASKEGYTSQTKTVMVIGGEIATCDFQLEPPVKVTFTANVSAKLYID